MKYNLELHLIDEDEPLEITIETDNLAETLCDLTDHHPFLVDNELNYYGYLINTNSIKYIRIERLK